MFYVGYVALEIKNDKIINFIKSKTFSVISLLFLVSAFLLLPTILLYLFNICMFFYLYSSRKWQ